MKMLSFRFLVLSAILTLCILVQHPRLASAAACPTISCGVLLTDCDQLCGDLVEFRQVGTCTLNGTTHKEFELQCLCVAGECYE